VVTTDVSVADLAEFLSSLPERHSHRTPAAKTTSSCVLSRRELEVLALVAHGLADGQIARSLYLSIKTVKNHLHHIYAKLGARSRTEAVVVAARQGLIRL